MGTTVVLVIDMLNDYFRTGPLHTQRATLAHHINALIARARESGWPVIWVRQEFSPDLSDAFLIMRKKHIFMTIAETEGCQLLAELDRRPSDHEIVKKRYSAFFQTELDALLTSLKADRLVIAGINTHACVRMAAIDAYQRDYEVVIPLECVASADRQHHEVTLGYLGQEIAAVKTVAEIFT